MSILNRFNPRERIILALLALVLVGLSLDSFVVTPYFEKRQLVTDNLKQAQEDLDWIVDAVNNLPQANTDQQRSFTGSLTNRVNELVQKMGLKGKLAQMTPVGTNEIRMRFSKIEFNQFIRLLARCQSLGIDVKTFRVDAVKDPALIDSSIVLTG